MGLGEMISRLLGEFGKKPGPQGDVILSSRVRLARNLPDQPFPGMMSPEQAQGVLEGVGEAIQGLAGVEFLRLAEIEPLERQLLVERNLISPQHAQDPRGRGLVRVEPIAVMVNEEDHLRIQAILPGLSLSEAFKEADRFDDLLEEKLGYAYDEEKGYLTACPTNLGTGLRASLMLHLPALALVDQLKRFMGAVSQVGILVRGIYGEGTEAQGNLYQISNKHTLGRAEEEIIGDLVGVGKRLVEQERQAREYLLEQQRLPLTDRVYRAYGVLSQARVLSSEEALKLLSDLRLGVDLGIVREISVEDIRQLLVLIRPAHLQRLMNQELPADERDRVRADLVRDRMCSRN